MKIDDMMYEIVLPLVCFKKRRGIVFFALKLHNHPGALERVSSILADANVNIEHGVHSISMNGKYGYWIFLADFSKARIGIEDILRRIKALDDVEEADFGIKWIENVGIPPFNVRVTFTGHKVVLWRSIWYACFFNAILERFGCGGAAFMYHVGKEAGKLVAEWWIKVASKEKDPGVLLDLALNLWKILGWISEYKIMKVDSKKFEFIVRLYDLYSCEPFRCKKEEAMGHFARGMLTGYLEGIINKPLTSIERKCIAKGDSYCEIVIEKDQEELS